MLTNKLSLCLVPLLASLLAADPAAQVITQRGGYAAQPIVMPSSVVPISAPPVVFTNDHATPVGYNVPTAVPLAGTTTGQAAYGAAPVAYAAAAPSAANVQAVGYSPTVISAQGMSYIPSGQVIPAPMVGPANGGIAAAQTYSPAQPVAYAAPGAFPQPVVFQGGMVSTVAAGGYVTTVPINAFGSVNAAPALSPNVQHAPIMSVVSLPTTIMTQRLVMPVQRP